MTDTNENPDHFIYSMVMLYADTMQFFLTSARYYQNHLKAELNAIRHDELFAELFSEADIQALDITRELERFRTIGDRIEQNISENPDAGNYTLSLRHQDIRVLKAIGILYLSNLDRRRDRLSTKGGFSTVALQALDSKMARFREILSMGLFKDATPWPLLVEPLDEVAEADVEPEDEEKTAIGRPPPRIISTIEIIDPQLRDRCLDLVAVFEEEEQSDRFDTVVSEATRILEHRVRNASKADASSTGVDLMTFAFGGEQPRLVISEELAEQQAAHLMFRGVSGFIRNPFHHRLIEDLSRERLLQILGLVDYLLFLTQLASRSVVEDAQSPAGADAGAD